MFSEAEKAALTNRAGEATGSGTLKPDGARGDPVQAERFKSVHGPPLSDGAGEWDTVEWERGSSEIVNTEGLGRGARIQNPSFALSSGLP